MVNVDPYMDVENSQQEQIDRLYSSDPNIVLDAVKQLKNSVIGSNKHKGFIIQMGVLPRLFTLLLDKSSTPEIMVETAVTLGSLARGTDEHVESLLEAGLINFVLQGLANPQTKLVEACLRCLRTVLSRKDAPIEVLYENPSLIPHLIQIAPQSTPSIQECVMTLLHSGCQTHKHQTILCEYGALDLLTPLLCSNATKVQIPSLQCLAQMCYQNEKVSDLAVTTSYNRKSIPDILVSLMSRDKNTEMQLTSAKCMTYLYRSGALTSDDPRIIYKALPTLVRMCQKDIVPADRVEGAETLAYLIEVDTELQRIASISDHLIPTLSDFLKYRATNEAGDEVSYCEVKKDVVNKVVEERKMSQEMKQAAFKAFASLAANDEDIRRKYSECNNLIEIVYNLGYQTYELIIFRRTTKCQENSDTDTLMENIMMALNDVNPKVHQSAIRCLHSLSRSVQQLRTTFQDHNVWRPLMKLLQNATDDVLTVASSTLCNLLLEFSPSKEKILESGAVEMLCQLTHRNDHPCLRLNGVWALMNMAFQADHKIKAQILTTLGSEHVFNLLLDKNVDVLMKTLGLLRNLLSTKPHIDHIMGLHGKQIMDSIDLILEGDNCIEIKEQALCILANIADGDFAKNFIMSSDKILSKLTIYMVHSNIKLQIASVYCISNLVWKDEDGAAERQMKLKDLGVVQYLQQLLQTGDTTLLKELRLHYINSLALHKFVPFKKTVKHYSFVSYHYKCVL
ncbi:armadillo repeat-containing protein 8 [Caerostris extrusa]|uniref:Armadillo repeat-containing protein 8 n=1 Tax=Caerostris extrusa TaxID=172846 RepID=A0AAV4XFM6_CAEEX|nr:armadillo repeat-containing protein 8 [Caerostris extrusa]